MATANVLAQDWINEQVEIGSKAVSATISEQQFIDGLTDRAKRGCFALTIETLTSIAARKTGNPYGLIFKRAKINGMANWIYENSVNAQRSREGITADFEAHPRNWGARIDGTPLIVHKGQMYLELKVQASLGYTYETADSTPLANALVEPFLPAKRDESGRQGTEKAVILRDYKICNILSATIDGQTYQIDHPQLITPAAISAA